MMKWYAKYIVIPFKEHGRDEEGCDCWGLARLIWKKECGILVPSYGDTYSKTSRNARDEVSKTIKENGTESEEWVKIKSGQEREFDAILLRVNDRPMHVGVVLPNKKFIHTLAKTNTCIQSYSGMEWRDRVLGFYRNAALCSSND